MRRQAALAAALLALLAIPSTGFGWFSLFSRSSYRAASPAVVYYCPVPVVSVIPYAVPAFPAAPPPSPPAAPPPPPRNYAEPRAAPPSSSPEPRLAPDFMPKAGVNIQESRKVDDKFFDRYFVSGSMRPPGGDRCAVTFWNLSGQDVTLTVDGQPRPLPARQNVRVDLKRDFTWSVTGREAVRQQVPAAESGVEIVIRRP